MVLLVICHDAKQPVMHGDYLMPIDGCCMEERDDDACSLFSSPNQVTMVRAQGPDLGSHC